MNETQINLGESQLSHPKSEISPKILENPPPQVVPALAGFPQLLGPQSSVLSPELPPELIVLTESETRANAETLFPPHQRPTCPILAKQWDFRKNHYITKRLEIEQQRADLLKFAAEYATEHHLNLEEFVLSGHARRAYNHWQDSLRPPAYTTHEEILAAADEIYGNLSPDPDDQYYITRNRNAFIQEAQTRLQNWQHATAAQKLREGAFSPHNPNLNRNLNLPSPQSSSQPEQNPEPQPEHEPEQNPDQTSALLDNQPDPITQLAQKSAEIHQQIQRLQEELHTLRKQAYPADPPHWTHACENIPASAFPNEKWKMHTAQCSMNPAPDADLPALARIKTHLNQTKQPRSPLDRLSPTRQHKLYELLRTETTRLVLDAVMAPKSEGGWEIKTSLDGLNKFYHRYQARLQAAEEAKRQQQIEDLNGPNAPDQTQAVEKLFEHRLLQTLQNSRSTPDEIQKITSATTRFKNAQTSKSRLELQKQ